MGAPKRGKLPPKLRRWPSSLLPGARVLHVTLGIGRIETEWGSWHACPICFVELLERKRQICRNCGQEIGPREFSGKGIYDVRFGVVRHSSHRSRLKPI